jgi:hypothetical protein
MNLGVSKVIVAKKPPQTGIPWSLAWLLPFCAVSTNSVITLYWEVQMT